MCWQGYFLDSEGNTFGIFEPARAAKLKDLVNAEGTSKPRSRLVDERQMHASHGSAAGIAILPEMPPLVAQVQAKQVKQAQYGKRRAQR